MASDTWRRMIEAERKFKKDDTPIVGCVPPDIDLDRPFAVGYGSPEGQPFTLWTERRVYFPNEYDGFEFVSSAPRDPCDEIIDHTG